MADTEQGQKPVPIKPAAPWVVIVGAAFGAVTLLGLFLFAYLAAANPNFVCNSFTLLAAIFAFGAALAAGFIGGAAVVNGQLGPQVKENPLAFTAGGGAAVFFIAFFAFHLMKPSAEICSRREIELEFDSIPTALTTTVKPTLWSKHNITGELGATSIDLLVTNDAAQGKITVSGSKQTEWKDYQCDLLILYVSDLDAIEKQYAGFRFETTPLGNENNTIGLNFSARPQPDNTKEANPSCFRMRQGKPIVGIIAISIAKDQIAFGVSVTDGEADLRDLAQGSTNYAARGGAMLDDALSFTVPALAGDVDKAPAFRDVENLLLNGTDAQQLQARQYLGGNFDRYKADAIAALSSAGKDGMSGDAEAALVSGLVNWIGTQQPSLLPGRGRDLNFEFPAPAKGVEPLIFDLTGSLEDQVKKQARRLVQRYPNDNFLNIYEQFMAQLNMDACGKVPLDNDKVGKLYGAIFFYYNRIIQYNYQPLTPQTIASAEAYAAKVHAAARCLPASLSADASAVDFGLATLYDEANGGDGSYRDQAKKAASRFLLEVQGREGQYYFGQHIDKMKALAAK